MQRKSLRLIAMMLIVFASLTAKANPVDMRTAREVAMKFVNANTSVPLRGAEDLQLVTTYNISRGDAAFHIFNTSNGFVIVAADDCAHPILAYSIDRPWPSDGNLPLQVSDYLDDLAKQIEAASTQPQDRGIATEWSDLLSGNYQTRGDRTQVGPLLTTTWDQGQYYNDMCPEDENGPNGHVYTGCVATAMAQIINYWGYPIQGRGSHSYNLSGLDPASMGYEINNYGTLSVNFDSATYDYNHMPDVLTSESTQEEIDAVAQLMYHCGVAVNMEYGPYASGAREEDVRSALISYFGFAHTLGYAQRQLYTNEEWMDSLRANIDRDEPVFYCGKNALNAHAFVLDGYNTEDYFHFNFGWSGDCDGWYMITAINPSWSFNEWQSAIMGIRPNNEEHAAICHRIMYVQNNDYFTITEPIDLYPMRGGSVYRATNELLGVRINLNLVPEDESGQVVLNVLEFDNEQSVVIYDGINKDSLVRVIETRRLDDWNTVTYRTWFYDGLPSDTIMQNMAGTDFSPIVSTRHGLTVLVYSYGGIPESFHLRVSDASDCRMVSNLTAVQDNDGVLVSWTENGDATQWQVMVGDDTYNCNETHFLLTELLPNESYEVKVRAICDEQHYSSWNTIIVNKKVYWTDVVKSEPEGYYLDGDTIRITTTEGLAWVAHCLDSMWINGIDYGQFCSKDISIENDIDLDGYYWNPIRCWFGNVNGNGHVINNMEVSTSRLGGLFAGIWDSEITEIRMINSKVNSIDSGGSISGYIQNCSVYNCSSENYMINVQNSVAGGLFGTINECQIKNCHAYGNNYSQFGYGGLVGSYNNSEMTNCVTQLGESFNWGSIFASAEWRGLLTEEVHGGSFSNCFSDISNAKWYNSDPETYRYYFLGNIYNVDMIDNLAVFNISIDPLGMLIADTAVNYTWGENIDVVTALNNMVAEYNLPDLRTWVRDEVTHMPVLGDYFEVTCPNVSDITIENIAYNDGFAVVLSWQENGAAEEWQVKYKMQNAPDSSATVYNISMTNDTIEGLQLGNMYEFYVRPICGDEPTVGWGQPYSFFVDKALWIDMVTECPEGYIEDSDGNVTISSPEGLAWLAKIGFDYRNNTIIIASDLDMGAYKWTPIGRDSFEGTVEGNNHVISNLYFNDNYSNIGLFGNTHNAALSNITIQNSSFTTSEFVGSLAGQAVNTSINNCHARNVIVKGKKYVGGLCGSLSSNSEMVNCSSSGAVYGDLNEGGLVGNSSARITNCYANCEIRPYGESMRMHYGGFVGEAVAIITNCYSSGQVVDGANDSWDRPGGKFIGHTLCSGSHLYAINNSDLPFVERVEDGVLSDTASFVNNTLQTPVTIGETSYTNLLDALNAWVDANNTNGEYLHWVADTAMVNDGFPMLERLPAIAAQISSLTLGWNWWAPTVERETLLSLMETILGANGIRIDSQDSGLAEQNDGSWSGDLQSIIPGQMYRIQTTAPCTLAVTGAPITTATVTINPGENWIGFIGAEKTVTAAFANFTPVEGDKVISQDEGFTVFENGEWHGTLETLQPGKGYVYVSNATEPKTLVIGE